MYLNDEARFPGLVPMLRTDRAGRPLVPAGACRDFFLYVEDDRLDEAHALLTRQLEGCAQVCRTDGYDRSHGLFGPLPPSSRFLDRVGNLVVLPFAGESVWWYEKDKFEMTQARCPRRSDPGRGRNPAAAVLFLNLGQKNHGPDRPVNFIRQFYRLVRPQRTLLALTIGCGFLFVAANLLPPLVIRRLIQWLTEGGGSSAGLLKLSVLLLGSYLIRGLVRYGYGLYSHTAAYQVMHRLMIRVYRHLQRMPHRFFHQRRTGELMSRSINDVETVEDFIAHGIPETFIAIVIPGAMLTVLFILDARLALIALLPIPLTAFLVFRYVSRVRSMWGRSAGWLRRVGGSSAGLSVRCLRHQIVRPGRALRPQHRGLAARPSATA